MSSLCLTSQVMGKPVITMARPWDNPTYVTPPLLVTSTACVGLGSGLCMLVPCTTTDSQCIGITGLFSSAVLITRRAPTLLTALIPYAILCALCPLATFPTGCGTLPLDAFVSARGLM
jgi:hypothetical protein